MMKAKDLKNSILQMAVEGKLVPQDPADEPASVLLDRIREERRKLITEGKLKFPKGGESIIYRASDGSPYEKRIDAKGRVLSDECIENEIPFEIPESWEWARLETVTTYISRGKSPKYSLEKRYPVVAQKCNQWSGFSIEKAKFVDPTTVPSYSEERLLRDGDLLWNSTGLGTLGRMAIYDSAKNKYGWAVADSHVTVIRTDIAWFNYQFAYLYFAGPSVQSIIEDKASGSTKQKELAQSTVRDYLIPFPPLAEQHRIVSRVGELLPLVEEYGRLEDAREELDSSLPDRLRKSVLQEAVEGRLVPQDPADEPASALLDRIRKGRHRLIEEGKLKFPKGGESVIYRASDGARYEKRIDAKGRVLSDECIEDEIPFDIPDSWEWARLGEVASFCGVGTPDKGNPEFWNGEIPWASMKDIHGERLLKTIDTITPKGLASKPSISICEPGQLIVSTRLTPGKAIISGIRCAINQDLKVVRTELPVEYLSVWFGSHLDDFKRIGSGTTVPGIKLSDLADALIPLPPLAEQHRIVTAINEVLALLN
ncbi:restriction endonuclease subunit S [Pseudoscardovia suis]|uniref:restriction endonuclease subunit S n=1 Tax=Pseudoscardovia suis TaxID=987063 RepID=UPI003F9A0988